jgi:hypothetical protein
LVPNQAPRGFAPGVDFAVVAATAGLRRLHRVETYGSKH